MLRGELRNIRKIVSFYKWDGYEFLGLDKNETPQFFAIYDLRCIRERRPGFSPPSLKNREMATAVVSRRVREILKETRKPLCGLRKTTLRARRNVGNGSEKLSILYMALAGWTLELSSNMHRKCKSLEARGLEQRLRSVSASDKLHLVTSEFKLTGLLQILTATASLPLGWKTMMSPRQGIC